MILIFQCLFANCSEDHVKINKQYNEILISCLNFWDEACWFLSLRGSSLLSFPQCFIRYVLWPSLGICWEPSQNFELRPLLNPWGIACSDSVSHNQVLACSQDWTCNLQMIASLEAIPDFSISPPTTAFRCSSSRNVVEITIKMKTIVRKPLTIKILISYIQS